MKPESILKADVLDIVFEGRNKEYGAYVLRREYDKRMYIALSGMLLLTLLFVGFQLMPKNQKFVNATTVTIPPDLQLSEHLVEPPKEELPKPQTKAASIQYTTPIISKIVDVPPPTVDDLNKDVQISTTTVDGPPASTVVNPGPVDVPPAAPVVPDEPAAPSILERSEIMPEYPGGEAALRRFLQRNLRFDFDDMEPGARIEIRCKFIVGKTGKVEGIQITKSGGQQKFDNEVVRVVGKMQDWKPGLQNGKNVNVYYTIPVIVEVPVE